MTEEEEQLKEVLANLEFSDKRITYIFEGDFDLENSVNLINFLNTNTQPVNLFINSPGGYINYIYPLMTMIEDYEDIVIYPLEQCSSSAFFLLLNTTVPIIFLDKSIISVVHFPRIESLRDFNNNNIYPKDFFKKRRHLVDFNEQLKTLPLPTTQQNKLLKGEDVHLFYEDLVQIFKDRLDE
jgi:ATP-dependent protease ClpP protease subunit